MLRIFCHNKSTDFSPSYFFFLCLSFFICKIDIKIKHVLTQHRPYHTSQVQPSLTHLSYKDPMRQHVYELTLQVVNGYINQMITVIV